MRLKGKDKDALKIVEDVFGEAGKDCTIHVTAQQGHAKEIAETITAEEENPTLIAMGGDGTLHEVLNGIKDVSACTMGVIPVGTGNDFAAAANIPNDVRAATELILTKEPSKIDYIQLSSGLRSLNAVGAGIDVDVLKRTYAAKHTGRNKYFKAFVKSLFAFKSVNFTVTYDGNQPESHHGLLVCMGNGKQIGGGIKLFPEADIRDGYMDLIIVDYLSKFKTLKAFIKLVLGKLGGIKEITQIKCKQVTLIPEDDTTIQAEGELYNCAKLEAKLMDGRLKFYLPDND
jgi:YegS/Rv2252/BmrU family lipid kinase